MRLFIARGLSSFLLFFLSVYNLNASAVELVISAAGDLSFSDNHLKGGIPDLKAGYAFDNGQFHRYEDLTAHLNGLFRAGDLNFANVETVVADTKRGLKSPKAGSSPSGTFAFISHPSSIEHVITGLNLNLFSLANNHANDFGASGLEETYESMARIKGRYDFIEYSGIFKPQDALRPVEFQWNGVRVAFAAVKSPNGSGSGNMRLIPMGSAAYQGLIRAFARSRADVKIMSVHEGIEGKVTFDGGQQSRYQSAVDQGGLHLILAHHPHVVRPIEHYKNAAIFYSLGNFLIMGAGNLDGRKDHYRNYGLVSRTYFEVNTSGTRVTAIEAIPIKGMHHKPYVPKSEIASTNIKYLNKLNSSESPRHGVNFRITGRGTGVACLSAASGPRARRICD